MALLSMLNNTQHTLLARCRLSSRSCGARLALERGTSASRPQNLVYFAFALRRRSHLFWLSGLMSKIRFRAWCHGAELCESAGSRHLRTTSMQAPISLSQAKTYLWLFSSIYTEVSLPSARTPWLYKGKAVLRTLRGTWSRVGASRVSSNFELPLGLVAACPHYSVSSWSSWWRVGSLLEK